MNPDNFTAAKRYYDSYGFEYIDVPYTVSEEVSNITKPSEIENFHLGDKVLVASAEQSFLQLIYDGKLENNPKKNTSYYQTITPCFRNELVLDELHKQYFMKLELIVLNRLTLDALSDMVNNARCFFNSYVPCKVIETGTQTYDIVTDRKGIELGSYGIRSHPMVGAWIYGTGLAEPRLTYAREHYND